MIRRDTFARGWMPDADDVGGPVDGLLRADNLVLDELGAVKLRRGSTAVGAALTDLDVHSLYTAVVGGVRQRCVGAGNALYVNGVSKSAAVAGSGDVAFGSYLGQVFWTRSTTHQKFDGTTVRNWGIAMTGDAPTTAPLTSYGTSLASFASGESPAFVASVGTTSFVADRGGVTQSAMKLQGATTNGRVLIKKTFAAPTDFSTLNGIAITDDDLLSVWANVPEPGALDSVTIRVDVNDGNWADFYQVVFPATASTDASDLSGEYTSEGYERRSVRTRVPRSQDGDPGENKGVGLSDLTRNTPGADATVGWQQWSVRRGAMYRRGSTPGKDWRTVAVVEVTVEYNSATADTAITLDALAFVGGEGRTLTGSYKHRYVYVRDDGVYQAPSAPSDLSEEQTFEAGAAAVSIPADATRDTQVTGVWVYRMGGDLDAWYRVATFAFSGTTVGVVGFQTTGDDEPALMTTEALPRVQGQATYTVQDEEDFVTSHSLTLVGPANHTCPDEWTDEWLASCGAATTFVITGFWLGGIRIEDTLSDRDALIQNIRLETDITTPPADIIGMAGPHYDRLWVLTDSSVWPSRRLNPDGYLTTQEIVVAGPDESTYWIAKAVGGLWVGTSKDIYRLEGDGAEYPDGTFNVTLTPMNVDHPPISQAVAQEGNSVVYLSSDGWRSLAGLSTVPLSGLTSLLYRGQTRHGVSPVNLETGRFRAAVGPHELVAITPEGASTTSSTVLYRLVLSGPARGQWYRHTYPVAFRSIAREPDGTLIAGDTAGTVWILDSGTQDGSTDLAVVLWTVCDAFDLPYSVKVPGDLRFKLDTGADTATVSLHVDGSATVTTTVSVAQNGLLAVASSLSALGEFTHLQFRLTLTGDTFTFYGYGLQAIPKPAGVKVWDSGPIDLGNADLIWLREVRIKAHATADLTVTPYFDDVAWPSVTVDVAAEATSIWTAPLGRGYKGKVPRVVVASTGAFEPYWVQFLKRTTSAQTDKTTSMVPAHL